MKIKVTKASDSLYWYAKFLEEEFVVQKITTEGTSKYLWVKEPMGYLNFVLEKDCEVIDE